MSLGIFTCIETGWPHCSTNHLVRVGRATPPCDRSPMTCRVVRRGSPSGVWISSEDLTCRSLWTTQALGRSC